MGKRYKKQHIKVKQMGPTLEARQEMIDVWAATSRAAAPIDEDANLREVLQREAAVEDRQSALERAEARVVSSLEANRLVSGKSMPRRALWRHFVHAQARLDAEVTEPGTADTLKVTRDPSDYSPAIPEHHNLHIPYGVRQAAAMLADHTVSYLEGGVGPDRA